MTIIKLICSHVYSDSEGIFSPDSNIGFQTIYWMNARCFFLFLTNLVRVYFPRHLVHTEQQILAVWCIYPVILTAEGVFYTFPQCQNVTVELL